MAEDYEMCILGGVLLLLFAYVMCDCDNDNEDDDDKKRVKLSKPKNPEGNVSRDIRV